MSVVHEITTEKVSYKDKDGFEMVGYLVYSNATMLRKQTVVIVHHYAGRDEYTDGRAEQLAKAGYTAFALDVYGNGEVGKTKEDSMALMNPLRENRALLQQRILAGLEAVRKLAFVDKNKIAVIGYCFGGMAVLDLARLNADVQGVVSFHGGLKPLPEAIASKCNSPIKPKILVLHGYNDPGIPQEQVLDFQNEMDQRKADWEINVYGDTVHSFTVPNANDVDRAMYSARADKRSWNAMLRFFNEIFE